MFLSLKLVPVEGIEPPSFGYEPNALPLSYTGIIKTEKKAKIEILLCYPLHYHPLQDE